MCLSASLYESHQQKKAAKEAQWRSQNAAHADALNAQAAASAEAAETPKEATPIEADEAAAVSFARKRQGIQSTQLNTHLG